MGEGLEKFKQLLTQGYGITKAKEMPDGQVKCIVTHSSTGMKKVVDLTKEEYTLALKMN